MPKVAPIVAKNINIHIATFCWRQTFVAGEQVRAQGTTVHEPADNGSAEGETQKRWSLKFAKELHKYDYQQQLDKNQRQNAATATVTATAATNNNVSGKLGNDSQN